MRRILVLRGGALGDFIVTLPALALLRRRWPEAHIELVGNAAAAALALHRGLLDRVHSQHEARWSALFDPAPLPAALGAWLAEFDLVVNYWPDPQGELRGHFPCRAGQKFLAAEAMPQCAPAAAHYCEPLRERGLVAEKFWFALDEEIIGRGRQTLPCIAVHPGSGSPRKNWPIARWRELIAELDAPLLLILGEAERETWRPLADAGLGSQVRLAENLPLETLVAELKHCRLFLGHDSGISHLAAACGVPSVLLFGPTDPAMWSPPAPHVRVLHCGPDLSSISIADVRQAITSAMQGVCLADAAFEVKAHARPTNARHP
ncbi:MAG TPA: glycosyltransferase family 9 protein [Opitutaceae bacterium]|nr:glycosyltransferase family 9 protein [Opitutaceae bacterium]